MENQLMNNKHRIFASGLLGLIGCATVDPTHDYDRAAEHIEQATGAALTYRPDDEAMVDEKVQALLADGLTAEHAAQIALLNNPHLQAAFFNVGMAHADVVQSGLWSNPSLGLSLRLPAGGGLANLEASIAQNIADLWQIPLRKRAAERMLDKAILNLARQASQLVAETKVAFHRAVGAIRLHEISIENLDISQKLLELSLVRQQAGAGSELDVNLARSAVMEAELSLEAARFAEDDARRQLAQMLGSSASAENLQLIISPIQLDVQHLDQDRLLTLAYEKRMDLQAARQAVKSAAAKVEQEYRMIFPTFELGVSLERGERPNAAGRDLLADTARASIANGGLTAPEIEPRSARRTNTDFIIGPSLAMELPIFDQNQAQIAKANFEYHQALHTLDALERALAQQVRGNLDRTRTASRIAVFYREKSVPLAQTSLDLSRESYKAGRASFLSVLEAQRFFLDNRRRYVEASQTADVTIPELEQTIGLPFQALLIEVGGKQEATPPATQPADGEQP
jgi:cobalt-zinc-cadmium efflux system outer membrane protein